MSGRFRPPMSGRFNWDQDALGMLWHWMTERQQAFYRRTVLHQPPPWSADTVVACNHFTNVYRELDPGTAWVVNNVLEQAELPEADRAFLVFAYRLFGTEGVFERLGVHTAGASGGQHDMLPGSFNAKWLASELQLLMDQGVQAFTPAYMVSNYGRKQPKSVVIADVLGKAAKGWGDVWARVAYSGNRQGAFRELTQVFGMGRFVAFQTLVDLCYPLRCKSGKRGLLPWSNDSWVTAGPGALRGLQLLLPGARQADDDAAIAELVRMQGEPLQRLGFPWLLGARNKPVPVNRSNMQNCLCELSKYAKLRAGAGGGRRRTFDPQRSYLRGVEAQHLPGNFAVQVDAFNT